MAYNIKRHKPKNKKYIPIFDKKGIEKDIKILK
jgi:hypothetical protein